ncbi:MAG: ATP-binding protein, partial [Planctomycetaceae bacterium]|nr:ATP-binding protein [Planctomycetaceae bacterium]
MAIHRVEIKDFLVFQDEFTADFCSGVNVLIGGNSTGKTTLMKTLYWCCELSNKGVLEPNGNLQLNRNANSSLKSEFLLRNYFNLDSEGTVEKTKTEPSSIIKLYSQVNGNDVPVLDVSISKNLEIIQFHEIGTNSQHNRVFTDWLRSKVQSVYIPVAEMLSHSRGFLALNRERALP